MPSERSGPVAGILLAAGSSSRMGGNKLLFELHGESVLRGAVRRAIEGGLSPAIAVLGHQSDRARRELADLPCRWVLNPLHEQGIGSSLRSGVAALPPPTRAAMVLLPDMPFVSPAMIAAVTARYRASAAPLVISDYAGVNAPPTLFDRSLFPELLALTGEGCGRHVVNEHRGEAEVLSWPAAALADMDVPDDYDRLRAAAGKS